MQTFAIKSSAERREERLNRTPRLHAVDKGPAGQRSSPIGAVSFVFDDGVIGAPEKAGTISV